jgi:hypothetical protein
LFEGAAVLLEREPANMFDANAIKILLGQEKSPIGHVPREIAAVLAALVDSREISLEGGTISKIQFVDGSGMTPKAVEILVTIKRVKKAAAAHPLDSQQEKLWKLIEREDMYSSGASAPGADAPELCEGSPANKAHLLPPPRTQAETAAKAQEAQAQEVLERQILKAAAAARAEEREDGEVGLSHKDADEQTFTEYVPYTFSAAIFRAHPDPVVETASLSSLMPPKTTHKLHLCAETITRGLLTNLQVPFTVSVYPFPALSSADS